MADFEYAKFTNEAISLDGNTYEGCTFTDCEIIIEASAPFSLANNDFTRCLWTFTGAAALTMNILTMNILTQLYQSGPETQEIIERTFESIRGRGYEGITVH